MDLTYENLEIAKPINIKGNVENITPYKIAVVAFIREYGLLKIEEKQKVECVVGPKYRKDFCILALKLIQCPDMHYRDLESLLINDKYNLLNIHLQNFCVRLQNIYVNGISALMDCITSTVDKLMIEQNETNPCVITRFSVLGFYLRRILLHLDRLTFTQVVSLYKAFCLYYERGRPGLMVRSLSKEKLNNVEQAIAPASTSPVMPVTDESKPNEWTMKSIYVWKDNLFDGHKWSRKQAELYTAQQANLLQINEKEAASPRSLQKAIIHIVNDVPEYPDVHFLSFMNCIRMREFCGAQDSLHNCFDQTVFSAGGNGNNSNDGNKNFRYAALNRAAMHAQFGHKCVAIEGVSEAVAAAQVAADGPCLAHAATWGALAGGRARRAALLAKVPRAPRLAASAAQLMAQHAAVNGAKPSEVFHIIIKGDSINYLHSMTDLTMAGLANQAALWSLYGKTEMASICCQLLLNLNTKCGPGGGGGTWHWTEASGTAAAGAACAAAWRGEHALAAALVAHLAAPAPSAPSAPHRALPSAHAATCALRAGKWEEADLSIRQLASYDRWESQLLKSEMYFLKGDSNEALESLHDILDYCKTEDDSLHFMSLRLRAMLLMSQVQHSRSSIQSTNIMLLTEALSLAKKYNLHYLAVTAEMHIANVQLHMGCAKNALLLVRRVLPSIMAHGSTFDMGRALLLYTKCRIASAPVCGEPRAQVLHSCCEALDTVKKHFAKVGAHSRLLQTWYLQAQLYNDIGNHAARNQCAWMYRQLETQNPIEPSNALLIMY